MKHRHHLLLGLMLALAAGTATAGEFVALRMRVTANGHELLSARRFQAPEGTSQGWNTHSDHPLAWQMLDGRGQVLSQGTVGDPRVLRGPLEPGGGHAIVVRPTAEYFLRVPVDARATDLQLQPLARVSAAQGSRPKALQAQGEGAGLPPQRLDLRGVMRGPQ